MICIVGADGFFGSYMQKHILSLEDKPFMLCLNHGDGVFGNSPYKTDMNFELRNSESIKAAANALSRFSDIRILYTSCVHNPDSVKKAPDEALYINTECYENFLENIKGLDVKKLIYTSSDTVYGESVNGKVFTEKDVTSPVNIYGEQKLLAEKITEKYGYCSARYSYMYSPSLLSRKKHFADYVYNSLKDGKPVQMLTDWVRMALTYEKAAEITYKLLTLNFDEKAVNVCGDTPLSKYDIGIKTAQKLDVSPSLVIKSSSKELGIFNEKRANEILCDNSLLKRLCNIKKAEFDY